MTDLESLLCFCWVGFFFFTPRSFSVQLMLVSEIKELCVSEETSSCFFPNYMRHQYCTKNYSDQYFVNLMSIAKLHAKQILCMHHHFE